jgi:hypothetical protein
MDTDGMKLPREEDYPSELSLWGETYKITFVKGMADYGSCDSGNMEIRIRSGMRPSSILKTFIHEAIHMVEFIHGFELPHSQVYLLEKALYRIIKQSCS